MSAVVFLSSNESYGLCLILLCFQIKIHTKISSNSDGDCLIREWRELDSASLKTDKARHKVMKFKLFSNSSRFFFCLSSIFYCLTIFLLILSRTRTKREVMLNGLIFNLNCQPSFRFYVLQKNIWIDVQNTRRYSKVKVHCLSQMRNS